MFFAPVLCVFFFFFVILNNGNKKSVLQIFIIVFSKTNQTFKFFLQLTFLQKFPYFILLQFSKKKKKKVKSNSLSGHGSKSHKQRGHTFIA